MKETWVDAKGFPLYRVSNLGNVVRVDTQEEPTTFMKGGRVQLQMKHADGRWGIVQLNRLVASSFYEDDISGYEINHVDGDHANNALSNFEYTTREQNKEHAYSLGLMRRPLQIENVNTGEVYSSATEAGRKIGSISAVNVPKRARETGEIFMSRGVRLRIVQ